MNTKGTKFLAVLAVLAMAFSAFAIVTEASENDAAPIASNVANEGALDIALVTAAENLDKEYALTVATGFAITTNKTIGSNVTVKIASEQTLTINAGKTLTNKGIIEILAGGVMTINGTVVNDGTITNNGADGVRHESLMVVGADATITSTSSTAKGLINGTNNPLVDMLGGAVKNQIIDSSAWTVIQQAAVTAAYGGTSILNPVTIDNCTFVLPSNGKGILGITSGLAFTITNNTFTSTAANVSKCINIEAKTGIVPKAVLTGNTYQLEGFVATGGSVNVTSDVATKIGTASTDDVRIDANVKKLIVNSTALQLNSDVTVEELYIYGEKTLTINAGKTLTVTKEFNILGTLTNSGTVVAPSAYEATKVTNGTVKVAGITGNVDSTTNPAGAITDASYAAGTDVIVTTGAVTSATIPAGKELVIKTAAALVADAVLDVSALNSQVTVMGIDSDKAFTVKLGAGATEKLTVSGFQGNATFAKGSIIIHGEGAGITSGTFTITDGDVVKLSGDVTNATFNYDKTTGSAKIIIEAGDENALALAGTITMGTNSARVTIQIDGEITGGTIANASSPVIINDGAKVTGTVISGTAAAITVYSGADINAIGALSNATWAKVTGKDTASGKWTYDAADDILTLNNYNGTYNFGSISNAIAKIDVIGDNVVSYAPVAIFKMFVDTATVSADTGSLTVNVDVSGMPQAQIAPLAAVYSAVFDTDGDLEINQVDLKVNITGVNPAWTAAWIEDAKIRAIRVTGEIEIYNSAVAVDVLSTSKDEKAFDANYDSFIAGIYAADIDFTSSSLNVKAAGVAVTVDDEFNIKSANGTVALDAYVAADVGAFKVQKTDLDVVGNVIVGNFTITNESTVDVEGATIAAFINSDKKSIVTLKDLELTNALNNSADFTVTGESVISGDLDNVEGTFTNSGVMYVYDSLAVTTGTFTNTGSISILAYAVDELDVGVNDELSWSNAGAMPTAGNVKINSIVFTEVIQNNDSSAAVKANVTFDIVAVTGYTVAGPTVAQEFTGTLVLDQITGGYTLRLAKANANITITYDGTADSASFGTDYNIVSTGSIVVPSTKDEVVSGLTYNIIAVPSAAATPTAIAEDNMTDVVLALNATMAVNGGTFDNDGTVSVYDGAYVALTPFIASGATFDGPLVVGSEAMYFAGTLNGDVTAEGNVTMAGTMNGNITTKGDVTVAASKTLTGNITTDGTITVSGKIVGDIFAKATVSAKDIKGNIEVSTKGGAGSVLVTVWKMTGDIIHNSTYNTTAPAEGTPETATDVQKITVASEAATTGAGVQISLVKGTNAVASPATEGKPGYFQIMDASGAAATDKAVTLTLTAGKIDVSSTLTLKERYALVIESGTTLEISDKNAQLVATGAALKVSDGATKNYEEGAAAAVTYGKVVYVMKYTVADGYTIYSNLAYALENSDQGSTLTVGQSTNVTDSVVIGTGITVEVPKDVILTFEGKNVSMSEGAKIVLIDNGRVVFQPNTDNFTGVAPADLPATYQWYAVSGTIEFDGNVMELDAVRFVASNATIYGVAATDSAPSKFNVALTWNEGDITFAKGNAIGTFDLRNVERAVDKASQTAEPAPITTPFSAGLIIDSDVTVEATTITDAQGYVEYSDDKGTVKKVEKLATAVVVNGTLKTVGNVEVLGSYYGEGEIVLAATRTLTIGAFDVYAEAANKKAAPVMTVDIVDTTDAKNGYTLSFVSSYNALGTETVVFTATTANLMTVNGTIGYGTIEALTTATLSGLVIEGDAVVIADAVKLISGVNTAKGLLKTKALDLNNLELGYDATYTEGAYTVYSYTANIDFDEVTDITIDGDNFNFEAFGLTVDLSGKDISITIKEGTTLVLDKPLIIGTAATSLGAGAVITGKIVIGLGQYMLVYPNVDISGAEILDDDELKAKNSVFDIDGTVYATAFANTGDVTLVEVSDVMTVKISGYTFTYWSAYSTGKKISDEVGSEDWVGATDATATLAAGKVSITVTSVEGVTYYMDGIEFMTTDIATKVTVGSVITMKISDSSKYEGTPKIDGKTNYVVSGDSDGKTITATGVTPIPAPEPEPAPSGMSLTEILLIVLVVLIAIMVVIIALRLNRS